MQCKMTLLEAIKEVVKRHGMKTIVGTEDTGPGLVRLEIQRWLGRGRNVELAVVVATDSRNRSVEAAIEPMGVPATDLTNTGEVTGDIEGTRSASTPVVLSPTPERSVCQQGKRPAAEGVDVDHGTEVTRHLALTVGVGTPGLDRSICLQNEGVMLPGGDLDGVHDARRHLALSLAVVSPGDDSAVIGDCDRKAGTTGDLGILGVIGGEG